MIYLYNLSIILCMYKVKSVHILVHWSKSLNEVLFTINYIIGIGWYWLVYKICLFLIVCIVC